MLLKGSNCAKGKSGVTQNFQLVCEWFKKTAATGSIAKEIENFGKSEQRELANRMAVLLHHLLKWQYKPARQGTSWLLTIKELKKSFDFVLEKKQFKKCVTR